MNIEEKFMKEALKEANKAKDIDEVPVGCVIVKDGKIISRGHNLREKRKKATAHAEICAIEKACKKLDSWRLNDCEIYVTVEPCPMCAGAIYQSRIKKIVFGTNDSKGGALGSSFDLFSQKNLNHYPEVVNGILQEECSTILKKYFQNKRNK